ncbi:MAG: replication-relaxation family protein [Candidatus Pristimantibacillus sp.]
MMDNENQSNVDSVPSENARRKKEGANDFSLGKIIDLITEREWTLLTDLYLCRCMPQSCIVETYFMDTTEFHYPDYNSAAEELKSKLDNKNLERAVLKTRRTLKRLKDRGMIEVSTFIPNSSDVPSIRRERIRGESWYYLSGRGLRVVEMKRGILEENRLSKHELDMERAKKDHYWELGKVYLDLRYKIMINSPEFRQFYDWDWYPSLSVQSDHEVNTVRPDAIFRIGEQIFFIELDRSTEPIQRSPFHTDQVSIEKKLERYRNVIKLSTNEVIRNGIIAFIVPDAVYQTRFNNIEKAAERVFTKTTKVFTGKTIEDIISKYLEFASNTN